MSIRTILVILLALVCGISAAWGMTQLRRSNYITLQPEEGTILVAAATLPRGHTVTEEDVIARPCPVSEIPENALSSVEEILDRSTVIPLFEGEPLLEVKLAPKGAGAGVAVLIPHGMRAYAIPSSRVTSSVAGFILPGNLVDVLLTLKGKHNDGTGGGSTTTLLQAVEILAVDQQLDAPADNKNDLQNLRSVTLLVTPKQASLLDLGQNMGHLTLSLRNPDDNAEAATRPATLADIRFRQEKPADPAAEKEESVRLIEETSEVVSDVFTIVTLRGSRRGQVQIGSGK